MDAKAIWLEGMSFDATADSGFVVRLGADPAVGGANDGFRPLELMAMSLAGCTAMDVISILRKKQQNVTAFEVRVHADRAAEHPKVFTHLTIEYDVRGHGVDETAVRRAIELSAFKYCPAQAIVSKAVPTDLKYLIYEDEEGASRLVAEGTVSAPAWASEQTK